ncbi:uncharacterized protein LOC134204387 [Armigeres subalbatus]|uniref:uncharacterized protein LOC134204387 n=1 Tax=Armigeres subalbatus TaxID=124917 RepID=UPI002ED514D5
MCTWLKFLVCLQLIGIACGHLSRASIVCYWRLRTDLDESLRSYLEKCDYVVVCDDVCDRGQAVRSCAGEKLTFLKQMVPTAKIMLDPTQCKSFELRIEEDSEQFCHEIEQCVKDGLYDGIDLDFNVFVLELSDQIVFGQILAKLRQRLSSKIIISLSMDAPLLSSGPLNNAIIQNVDFVTSYKDELIGNVDQGEEFVVRKYADTSIEQLLANGIPPKKIVLGLKTAGIAKDPLAKYEKCFKKCVSIGLIPYGQVCELRDQGARFCSWRSDRQCILFDGRSKLFYDNLETAKERALQCTKHRLKGVSILLNYDDGAGICGDGNYPLLSSVHEVFSSQLTSEDDDSNTRRTKHNNRKSIGHDNLDEEIDRLELAIEHLQKSTNLLETISSFLLRALYKVIDVVIAFVSKGDNDGPHNMKNNTDVRDPIFEKHDTPADINKDNSSSLETFRKEAGKIAEEQKIPIIATNEEEEIHEGQIDIPKHPAKPKPVESLLGI